MAVGRGSAFPDVGYRSMGLGRAQLAAHLYPYVHSRRYGQDLPLLLLGPRWAGRRGNVRQRYGDVRRAPAAGGRDDAGGPGPEPDRALRADASGWRGLDS